MADRSEERRQVLYIAPWRVDVVTRDGVRPPVSAAAIARAVGRALEAAHAPEPGSVTIVLTDDGELEDLNVAHMGHDGPTDVLSFPMLEPGSFHRSGPDDGRPRRRSTRTPPHRRPRTHIGDIAISVERATEQATEGRGGQTGDVRWSAADELRLLVTHGTLHLCGWDHAEPHEEVAMRALEHALLTS
jgi:probable rRNA maturation factor